MKKIFLFIILLSVYSFGQENRTVRQNDLADTLTANSRGFAKLASPTFTGTVKLPSSIYINNGITDVALAPTINELNFVDGVTSAIQTQLNTKATTTITDSLADDIANIADSNFVLTSEIKVGTDSIHYGQDSIVVTHGVGSTPQFVVIQLVSDGFGFQTWVSGINSLTFYVRRSDTGLKTITSSIQFKWMAYK